MAELVCSADDPRWPAERRRGLAVTAAQRRAELESEIWPRLSLAHGDAAVAAILRAADLYAGAAASEALQMSVATGGNND